MLNAKAVNAKTWCLKHALLRAFHAFYGRNLHFKNAVKYITHSIFTKPAPSFAEFVFYIKGIVREPFLKTPMLY